MMRQAVAVQRKTRTGETEEAQVAAWEGSISAMRRIMRERDEAEARAADLESRLNVALSALTHAQADVRELSERCRRLERANARIVTMGDTVVREIQAMQGELHAHDLGVTPPPRPDIAEMERQLGELAESLGGESVIDDPAPEYLGAEVRS